RNSWGWEGGKRPSIRQAAPGLALAEHESEGRYSLRAEGAPPFLFTENETNHRRLFGGANAGYVKDGINDHVVHGSPSVNPELQGTKCAAHYRLRIDAGRSEAVHLRLTRDEGASLDRTADVFAARKREADEFYATVIPDPLSADAKSVMRQALAGMLWSKQFYHYVVRDWLSGDEGQPAPPNGRKQGRNSDWGPLYNADILSMPDTWAYPWFAAWDLPSHAISLR